MAGDTSNAAYISGINERPFMWQLARSVRPGSTIFDFRANIGYTALWLAKALEAELVAFEPVPQTFDSLRRNAALNPRLEVGCENFALGATEGEVQTLSTGSGTEQHGLNPEMA